MATFRQKLAASKRRYSVQGAVKALRAAQAYLSRLADNCPKCITCNVATLAYQVGLVASDIDSADAKTKRSIARALQKN